jgi:hypothetical protein
VRSALHTAAGVRALLAICEGTKATGPYDRLAPPSPPLVLRYLQLPVAGRVRQDAGVETALDLDSLAQNLDRLEGEKVEAVACELDRERVAICQMRCLTGSVVYCWAEVTNDNIVFFRITQEPHRHHPRAFQRPWLAPVGVQIS